MVLCLCHALVYIFVTSSLVCHVYFMLCNIFLLFLSFIWVSFSHSSCIPHAPSLPLFISSFLCFLPLDSFVYPWQKREENTEEYIDVYRHFYMTHVHILRGRNSTLCTFVGVESHDAYTKGEKTPLWENLVLSCFTFYLFSRCFMVLWVTFSIYALLLSSHRDYVLDKHTSLCYCASLVACLNDHLLCYMIIVVISTWLFCVWSSCSYVLQHVYLLYYTCPFITWFTLRV